MNNEVIFELLSDAESTLFYAKNRNPENEKLQEAYTHALNALIAFTKATGCHN